MSAWVAWILDGSTEEQASRATKPSRRIEPILLGERHPECGVSFTTWVVGGQAEAGCGAGGSSCCFVSWLRASARSGSGCVTGGGSLQAEGSRFLCQRKEAWRSLQIGRRRWLLDRRAEKTRSYLQVTLGTGERDFFTASCSGAV